MWMVAHMQKGPKNLPRMRRHMKRSRKVVTFFDSFSCVPPFMSVCFLGGGDLSEEDPT